MPGDLYLRADVDTAGHGWLTFEYDDLRREEVTLDRWHQPSGVTEHWVSLDRAEDRDAEGRPASPHRPLFDLRHVGLEVDMRPPARRVNRSGASGIQARRATVRATVTVAPLVDDVGMLWLWLGRTAEVLEVLDEDGRPLPFIREHIGALDNSIPRLLHDPDLFVFLDRPTRRDEPRSLTVVYERLVRNYLPGGEWYPVRPEDPFQDPHTVDLTIVARKKHDIRAMGRPVDETVEGDVKRVRYTIDVPVKMATFSYAERFHESVVRREGVPAIVAFAVEDGRRAKIKSASTAEDLATSIAYFQELFDHPLGAERLYATAILSFHGQSFEGFLHLANVTFQHETRGRTERFRAHEAAHQWWGHVIGWDSYRDQWLSEAFAEYSAAMFVQAKLDDGEKKYEDFLREYEESVLGGERTTAGWDRTGPIALGIRASTGHNPRGYYQRIYHKGALVMHMLRTLLRDRTGNDDAFVTVLRTFVARFAGQDASTADFVATLTAVVPDDWRWFFAQWVEGTDVPTYAWRHTVEHHADREAPQEAPWTIVLDIEQRDVAASFRMPVPVRIVFANGDERREVVLVDEARQTFTLELPAEPEKVELNPDRAVLARMRRL